jgi:antitoxin VapB
MAYRVEVFSDGLSQAVRLPKKYAFSEEWVLAKKIDDVVLLFPERDPRKPFLAGLERFTSDFLSEGRC